MSAIIGYSRSLLSGRFFPIVALVWGILSGPAVIGCAWLFAQLFEPDYEIRTIRLLNSEAIVIWIGGALAFSIVSFLYYSHEKRSRQFSMIGMITAVGWFLVIAAMVFYAFKQANNA